MKTIGLENYEEENSNQAGLSAALDEVNSEKKVLKSKTFKDGAIYLFVRADYKRPTWMCQVKVPNRTGYICRSTRTTNEHEAFKFADDLYHKELVKVLGGEKPSGQKIGKAIDGYRKRFESDRSRLSIHYKLLLLDRCELRPRTLMTDCSPSLLLVMFTKAISVPTAKHASTKAIPTFQCDGELLAIVSPQIAESSILKEVSNSF